MNLYTRLVTAEARKHTARLERIEAHKHQLIRAEQITRKLADMGLDIALEADDNLLPVVTLKMPIDLLSGLPYLIKLAGKALNRAISPDGENRYLILPREDENTLTGLPLVVEAM